MNKNGINKNYSLRFVSEWWFEDEFPLRPGMAGSILRQKTSPESGAHIESGLQGDQETVSGKRSSLGRSLLPSRSIFCLSKPNSSSPIWMETTRGRYFKYYFNLNFNWTIGMHHEMMCRICAKILGCSWMGLEDLMLLRETWVRFQWQRIIFMLLSPKLFTFEIISFCQ